MMNGFEKYLQENKQKLELDSVNPDVWLSIENEVLRKKNHRQIFYLRVLSVAAAILIGIIFIIGISTKQEQGLEAELFKVYGLEKYDFRHKVSQKTASLSVAKIPLDRKQDFAILINQLEFLDVQYRDYLQYIEQNGYQEFIGKQILHYYKSKIDLLDRIQEEVEKINYYENKFPTNSPTIELNI